MKGDKPDREQGLNQSCCHMNIRAKLDETEIQLRGAIICYSVFPTQFFQLTFPTQAAFFSVEGILFPSVDRKIVPTPHSNFGRKFTTQS